MKKLEELFVSFILGCLAGVLTFPVILLFATLVIGCGESQEDQWIREEQLAQDSLHNAYYEDSLRDARIQKFMRDANCDIDYATKQIDEVYYKKF